MTPAIDEPLKACPFCGGAAGIERHAVLHPDEGNHNAISCRTCRISTCSFLPLADAVAKWNARPAPPADVAAAVQEWLLSDMPGDTVEEKQHRAWLATQLPAALRAKLGIK